MRSVQSTLFTLLVASGAAFADSALNLTQGVSPISHDVYELHMTIFWICVVIGLAVFGVMFYSIIFHRKSRGAKPANFHSHAWLEIGWTIIPALILVVMAIPATKVLINMNNYDQEELTIKITGYQWKWHYEYIEDGVGNLMDAMNVEFKTTRYKEFGGASGFIRMITGQLSSSFDSYLGLRS